LRQDKCLRIVSCRRIVPLEDRTALIYASSSRGDHIYFFKIYYLSFVLRKEEQSVVWALQDQTDTFSQDVEDLMIIHLKTIGECYVDNTMDGAI